MRVNYKRVNFQNRVVQHSKNYVEEEKNGSIEHTPAPGDIYQEGTKLNEATMNTLDKGIDDCAKGINELEEEMIQELESKLGYQRFLNNTDSIDNIFQIGMYYWNSVSIPADCPVQTHAKMLVIGLPAIRSDIPTNGKCQIIIPNTGKILVRNGASTRWEQWYTINPLELDAALSVSGAAADAQAVGQALSGKQSKLTFDSTPKAGSTNPVTSKGIKAALDGKASTDTASQSAAGLMSAADKAKLDGIATGANKTDVDSALSASSTNPVQNKVIKAALDGKQAALTFDSAPKSGSRNPVTSGGVYTAISNKVKSFSASIPISGWTSNAGVYYTINVTVTGILASDTPDIGIVQTGTWETDEALRDAWACITRIVTGANKLTITAESIPGVEIPIQIQCVR